VVTVWRATFPALDAGDEPAAWLSDALGLRCRLVRAPADWPRRANPEYAGPEDRVAFADGYPVLIANEASLGDLNARVRSRGGVEDVPMERFRPNVVLSGAAAPWVEDVWKTLAIEGRDGPVVLRAAKPSDRCAVTTIDQETGEKRGPEPLASLARFRRDEGGKVYFGVNFAPERSAVGSAIRVGDAATASE